METPRPFLGKYTQPEEEYNFDLLASEIAESKGLIVVMPKPNQLQIDIDSDEQYAEFHRRLECFVRTYRDEQLFDMRDFGYEEHESSSGLPKRHITLTFWNHEFTEQERILYQAALGDDVLRVFLNTKRLHFGVPSPSRLFEKPISTGQETEQKQH